jgi:hypothetical protein
LKIDLRFTADGGIKATSTQHHKLKISSQIARFISKDFLFPIRQRLKATAYHLSYGWREVPFRRNLVSIQHSTQPEQDASSMTWVVVHQ